MKSEWCEKVGSNVGTGRLITEEGREEGEGREGRWDRRGGGGEQQEVTSHQNLYKPTSTTNTLSQYHTHYKHPLH